MLDEPLETARVVGELAQHAAQRSRRTLHQVEQTVLQEMGLPAIGPPGQAAGLDKQAKQLQLRRGLGVGTWGGSVTFLGADLSANSVWSCSRILVTSAFLNGQIYLSQVDL